jgi:hypothetical protein
MGIIKRRSQTIAGMSWFRCDNQATQLLLGESFGPVWGGDWRPPVPAGPYTFVLPIRSPA